MSLPFANDGSFFEQFQRAQQGGAQQQHGGEQDPAQLASSGAALPQPPHPSVEEGELAGEKQQYQQYGYQVAPDPYQGHYAADASALDPQQQHPQQQDAAYAQHDYAAAAADYQQDQYGAYPPQQQGQPGPDADAHQWQLQAQYDAYPSEQARRQYEEAQQQAAAQEQYLQQHFQQQQQQQQQADTGEERDFNACEKFFGPWEGSCFKLGEQGLGYYKLKEWPPAVKKSVAKTSAAAENKPKVILGNNSIIKGLAPKGGVAKKKKADDAEKPAYLREMETWQRQACSKDDARRSLVK